MVDFGNFLHDERCWGVDCGNKCLGCRSLRIGAEMFKGIDNFISDTVDGSEIRRAPVEVW